MYPEKTGKVKVGVLEEDLAIRHICRRLMCIVQHGIASKVTINELPNVFR